MSHGPGGSGGGHADGAGVGDDLGAGLGDRDEDPRPGPPRRPGRGGPRAGPRPGRWRFPGWRAASRPAGVSVAVRADPAPGGQPGRRRVPLLVGPAPDGLQVLAPHVQAAAQHQHLAAVDVRGGHGREVPVAAVLAQRGGRLPEPPGRVLSSGSAALAAARTRPAQSASPAARPSRSAAAAHLRFQPAEQAAQRADRPGLADPRALRRARSAPRPRGSPG